MKFSLVFDKSGDYIEFDVINNHDILEYFVSQCQENDCNSFTDDGIVANSVDNLLNDLHNAVSLTNSVMRHLCELRFQENDTRLAR